MARALGANAQLLAIFESVYGTSPGGNFAKLPFISADFNPEQKLIPDDTIGHGREPIQPGRDVIDVNHSFEVPVDLANIGFWLKGLLGAPTTTGSGPDYTHTYVSGGAIPSLSIETGFNDVAEYFLKTGARIGNLKFDFKPSGLAVASGTLIAQNEVFAGTSVGGTPSQAAYTRFNQFQAGITLGGSPIAGITAGDLTYDNKLTAARVIREDGLIEDADALVATANGKLTAFFENTSLFEDAIDGTAVDVTFGYTIASNKSLIFTLANVLLPQPKNSVKGPGGVQASFDYEAFAIPGSANLLSVVLKNQVASY